METKQNTSRGIIIDKDSTGYIVCLTRNGHRQVKAHGLQSFASVYDSVINLMTIYQLGMESVAVPYRLLVGIPLNDCKGWVFANYCMERACITSPDALI